MERTKAVLVRVTPEEHQAIRVRAAQAGLSMEAYGRQRMLANVIEIGNLPSTPAEAPQVQQAPVSYAEQLKRARGGK